MNVTTEFQNKPISGWIALPAIIVYLIFVAYMFITGADAGLIEIERK